MVFKVGFEETEYCIDGQSILHIVATSETAASSKYQFTFSLKLSSTNGLYTYEWPEVLLPNGDTSVTIPFVVPLEWANDATTNDFLDWHGDISVTMSVLYELYLIGEVYEANYSGYAARLNVSVSDELVPTVGELSYESVDGKVPEDWGKLVQGLSVVRVSAPLAAGSYSSKIERYYFGSGTAQTENYADISLQNAGITTVSVTVQDSRGRTATQDLMLNVEAYAAPVLTQVSSQRCDEDGELSEEGTCFLAKGTLVGYALSGDNPVSVAVAWKKVTEDAYGEAVAFESDGEQIIEANLEEGASYDVQYTICDTFYTINLYDYVSSTVYLLHFLKGGTGIAVGKAAEQESLFDVALDTTMRRDLVVGGDASVTGSLVIGGVNVLTLLQTLETPSQTEFSLNTALFSPTDVTQNQIVRCGRQVVYQLQASFNDDPLPVAGQTIVVGTIPSGWYSPDFLPKFTAVQNGINLCVAEVSSMGEVTVLLTQSWQQALVLTGTGIILE